MRKMMRYLFVLTFLLLPPAAGAQKSVSQLPPAHAAALQEFLSTRPTLDFLPETSMDEDTLKDMRKNFGTQHAPYYRRGDFNHDGLQDFAMIVIDRNGRTTRNPELDGPYATEYELTVVIFNGQRRGGLRAAYSTKVDAPLVCSLFSSREKKSKLYFGVYATDGVIIFTPAGRGYIAEYDQ